MFSPIFEGFRTNKPNVQLISLASCFSECACDHVEFVCLSAETWKRSGSVRQSLRASQSSGERLLRNHIPWCGESEGTVTIISIQWVFEHWFSESWLIWTLRFRTGWILPKTWRSRSEVKRSGNKHLFDPRVLRSSDWLCLWLFQASPGISHSMSSFILRSRRCFLKTSPGQMIMLLSWILKKKNVKIYS